MQTIILYGMRGSGKTTIGKVLANRLGCSFFDLDQLIADNIGMSVFKYVEKNGWDNFRGKENIYLSEVLALDRRKVISLGGGTVTFERNRDLLKLNPNNILIFIDCPIQKIAERIGKDQQNGKRRNSLTGNNIIEELEQIYEKRIPCYSSLYDYKYLNTKTPEDCVRHILETVSF